MTLTEEWRPVPGFPGYEVSDLGRLVSHQRRTPRLIQGYVHQPDGYLRANLTGAEKLQKKVMVHRLVLLAFEGPCPEGLEIRHLDGDPTNNSLSNLAYGTHSENMLDRTAHGNDPRSNITHCPQLHPYDASNTYTAPDGSRNCRICRRAAIRRWRMRIALRAAGIEVSA